ncbi:MAG: hypothetical protein HYV97_01455 [Bdellovibrio sp.]|nr:hypothetical protein [Bdellovibrio sp.]
MKALMLTIWLMLNIPWVLADGAKIVDDKFHVYIATDNLKKMAKYIKKHGCNIYSSAGEHALLTSIKFTQLYHANSISLLVQGCADLHLPDIGGGRNALVEDFFQRLQYNFLFYSTSTPMILNALLSDPKTTLNEIEGPFNHCSTFGLTDPTCLVFVNNLLAHSHSPNYLKDDVFFEKIKKIIGHDKNNPLEFFGHGELPNMDVVPVLEMALDHFKYILAIFQDLYHPENSNGDLADLMLKQNVHLQNFAHLYGKRPFHEDKSKMFISLARLLPKESLLKLLNTRDVEGKTMLHYVHSVHDPDLLEYVKLGGDPLIKDKGGQSVLDLLVASENWPTIVELAKYIDDFPLYIFQQLATYRTSKLGDFQLRNGRNAAHMLMIAKMTDQLPALKDFEALLMKRDTFGNSPFHYLAMYGDAQDFDLISKLNMELKDEHLGPNQSGNTFLHVAVRNNNLHAIAWFLGLGRMVNEKNPILDMTPLYMAVKLGHFEAGLKILAHIRKDVSKDSLVFDHSDDVNIIHMAIEENRFEMLRPLLLHCPKLLQVPNLEGKNVFQVLAQKGEFKAIIDILDIFNLFLSQSHIDLLIDRGLDPGNDYGTGATLFHKLIEINRHALFPRSKINKELIDLKDAQGRTVLHLAVLKQNAELIKELLDWHANPNILDNDGFTAAHYFAFKTPGIYSNKKNLYQSLIASGLDANIKSAQGLTFYGHVILDGEFVEIFLDDIDKKTEPFITDNDGNNLLAQLILHFGIEGVSSEDNLLLEETLIHYAKKIYQFTKDRNGEKNLTLSKNRRGENALDLARKKYAGISNKLVSFLFNHAL